MKRFLVGADRGQSTLLPECLDEWIDESNPVRAVDAFVDALDLGKLGFEGVVPEVTYAHAEYRDGYRSGRSGGRLQIRLLPIPRQ
jgi:hypothetical protein